ncbi:uncharacterized protein BX664DRAFT_321707 [Halteromyces radiatus]|uniref:uncharacterized protein n=1 Tax=Halteromyces radiatus TaxID=101107 RepID=UPI00221F2045|nr:uncharacterized protein BX664DRAFT_321707 [Halteromyces radiatus]KAI8099603.1 hypothetical protein BX664DRAFT_321707 [Halteromyces radiatus]
MSHQSGIQVSEELTKTFNEAVSSGDTRILRVSIVNESLVSTAMTKVEGSFDEDYNKIDTHLEDKTPAYLLVRTDEKTTAGEYNWLFLCYVPDGAKVRDKMLYASTKATLTKELGDSKFTDSIYGTQKSEFSKDGYKKHLAHKNADAPLTQRERELAEIKAAEAQAVTDYQGTTTRKTYAPGIAFPLTNPAVEALGVLKQSKSERSHNFVTLLLDKEKIELDGASTVAIKDIKNKINADAPRFTFYLFEHEHNGESKEAIVFIYTCPPTSKIREKMLYSSSKANVITGAVNQADIQVMKKFETSDPSDVTEDYLLEDLYPVTPTTTSSTGFIPTGNNVNDRIQMLGGTRGGFKRPTAPGRRRPATHTQS